MTDAHSVPPVQTLQGKETNHNANVSMGPHFQLNVHPESEQQPPPHHCGIMIRKEHHKRRETAYRGCCREVLKKKHKGGRAEELYDHRGERLTNHTTGPQWEGVIDHTVGARGGGG